jgi:hypothetical protein
MEWLENIIITNKMMRDERKMPAFITQASAKKLTLKTEKKTSKKTKLRFE